MVGFDKTPPHGVVAATTLEGNPGCDSIGASRWACIYTHPQAEAWANANLIQRGYTTYLPTHAVRVRDRVIPSLTHTVIRPLFSRYLFVRFDHTTESWSPIRATPGVVGILRAGATVHYASPGTVERLQATEAQRTESRPAAAAWATGDACTLIAGPLGGRPAVVVEVNPRTICIALIMLGGLREMFVTPDAIEPRA